MWRSFWRPTDRFSLHYFKYVVEELREIKVVHKNNRELVIDILQSIVEIVTYGDRHDPMIFECFMEYQVLAEFARILKISRNSRIEAPLLQYLSIMIQNLDSDQAIYYCFSNEHINGIIAHKYEFDKGDLAQYYVSFLRAVSCKVNRDTLCLLVKVHGDAVVSFPLYNEALKFACHGEKMIQIAVRALTLNVYNVSDDMTYQYITTLPVSKYFSNLVHGLREQCVHLDSEVHATRETHIDKKAKELLLETDKIVDDLYYFKDMLSVGESRLSRLVSQNLLSILVFPILLQLQQLKQSNGSNLSTITSLYILSRLLQVVGGKEIINAIASMILYCYTTSSMRGTTEGGNTDHIIQNAKSFFNRLDKLVCPNPECEVSENNIQEAENGNWDHMFGHLVENISSDSPFASCPGDSVCMERIGLLPYIFSDNYNLVLASLFLLLVLAENKDIDHVLSSTIGLSEMQATATCNGSASPSQVVDGSIFAKFMPQILNALLKVLSSQPLVSVSAKLNAGWFLRKLLLLQGKRLDDHNLHLFNTSYEQSCECLQRELDGCWFDHIPDTLRNEWTSCREALEESSQRKDPLFALELTACQQMADGHAASHNSWQRMVDTVKVFILHLQLKAFILEGNLLDKPSLDLTNSPAQSGKGHAADHSSASFGSEVSLGSGIPCQIAFSNAGVRDICIIPVARGITGKLLLVEKHPLRSRRGIVIAIAPLAGLLPKMDDGHPTWLHLQIREFKPRSDTSKIRGQNSKISNHATDGKWTLGFSSKQACEAARILILAETSKQRSSVESILAPFLSTNYLEILSDE